MTNPYSEIVPHQQCHASTQAGTRCSRKALPDLVYCRQHAIIGRAELVVQGYCQTGTGLLWTNGTQPSSLFHYTSVEALKSILESDSLWLSRSDHMNDQVELTYGAEVLLRMLGKRKGKHIHKLQELAVAMRDHFLPVFVFSTAFGEDSWAHWSAFSNNNSVCIEFSLSRLSTLVHVSSQTLPSGSDSYRPVFYQDIFQQRVGRVIYDPTLQEYYANKAIEISLNYLDNESLPLGVSWISVRELFITLLLFFKTPEFYMETEYRLCLMGTDDNPDYSEVVNSRAVSWIDALPYINLPLNSQKGSPISSIMAGPRLRNWDTQLPPIKDYLNTLGVPDDSVSIRRSKIKLRF